MTENEKIINLINELSNIFTMYFRYTWQLLENLAEIRDIEIWCATKGTCTLKIQIYMNAKMNFTL